ncbi:RNA polymerase sigma factor [Paenisporosarcina antarctica]|uniref:Sigma-70 family RNA polymerase sigma factor n=1 Tax=Paenisporosarcina antarctica TaxID=417367 RepID=A0A4P6ZWF3_9BACL|nr:sigma-70 family RNA polymerase sigma factor [Paenisporosarcina antarctica]QBP40573.1 sigma-70 family RNA polymerase sigma factor [Paenisporosarcina antarctica]
MQDTKMDNSEQNGNLIVFGELIYLHHRTVEKYAFQCGVKAEDIHSVTQEVFINLNKKSDEFQNSHFLTWLFKITLKASRDYHNREKRVKDEVPELQGDLPGQSTRLPQSRILLFDEDRELHDALQLVVETYRNPFILFYFHELGYDQIGEILNIKPVEVESRLISSKESIKSALEIVDDQQFELHLNLLKKSYKRVPSKFNADEILRRIESERGKEEDLLSSKKESKSNKYKVKIWITGLSSVLLIGILSTSFFKNDNIQSHEVTTATDSANIENFKITFEEQKTTYRSTLGLTEEEFNDIEFVKMANQLFASTIQESATENGSSSISNEERYEEVLDMLKIPSQMVNDASAQGMMEVEESAIFIEKLNTKIDSIISYNNSVLEKHREILNTAKMSGKLDATYLLTNRSKLPDEVESLINHATTQGVSIRVSRDKSRYQAFFEFPNHWYKLYEHVQDSSISLLNIKPMIPFTYGGELVLTPQESAMYLNELEYILLSMKNQNSLYTVMKSQYEDLAYTLIFGASNTEVVTNGRVNEEFYSAWNNLRYSYGVSPMKYFIRPMFESVSENNWEVNETYRSLNFNDLQVAFNLAENGDLAAIMPKENSGAKSATITWPNSEIQQKVEKSIKNTDTTQISQIVGLSPIESVLLYHHAQEENLLEIQHSLLSFMNFTEHENMEKIMNSWLNNKLIPRETTSLRYQDEETFEQNGNFVGSVDVMNGEQVIRTIPVTRNSQGMWVIDASLSYLLYSEPHIEIDEQILNDIQNLYSRFRENYDYSILKDISASLVAGIYLEAASKGDLNTQYELLLKGENSDTPNKEKFLSGPSHIEPNWKEQYNSMEAYQTYPSDESLLSSRKDKNDEFDVTVWLYITPELITGELYRNGFQIRKTVEGWRVYYMPIQ